MGRRLAVGRLAVGRRVGRRDRRERDAARRTCGCCRSPASAPGRTRDRARSPTRGPPCWARRSRPAGSPAGERVTLHGPRRPAHRGHALATGRRRPASAAAGASRRSSTRTAARPGRRSGASSRSSCCSPRPGFAVLDVDFRGSTGYGRAFRHANHDEWGHADVHDVIDAARWAAEQPWSDGRLAIYGGSYGGYLVLCALVEEPALWRAGVDLYGDSEIAESYRHGDRLGPARPAPDDGLARRPGARRASTGAARRSIGPSGSRRPLLILHGRKDKRVVPLMTERMVEALEIEGKTYEVHWYDDEGHGWERRENRRDAFERILAFLRTHVLDEPPASRARSADPPVTARRAAPGPRRRRVGITLIEPSVSRTASRTSSIRSRARARGRPLGRPRSDRPSPR